ncbi:MarR family winged helix-turn-helix transcriptional regulator [Paenibacillus sp. MAH-36]|uniref:MarR family transcriptional regulator n=1 Tax=Paenibacillus violae TaxID=3077234 RepID=A0ABU3RJN6_9BACL|nr:MarR family transcriptional regulator [Paenibacillus sp. PFR10]MDU0204493.1 MarR family transcriptional regulator [Paenibacillus sp. PFR10]
MYLETNIAKLLRQLTRYHKESLAKRINCLGLTPPQFMTLCQIKKEPKTIGQIVDAVDLSYSTVSGIIDRLERDGWLERVKDEVDRRVTWIYMSEKKLARFEENTFFQEANYSKFLNGFSEEELVTIHNSFDLITRHLEKKVEEKS